MNMLSYNRTGKKSQERKRLMISVVAIIVGVGIVWSIARAVVGTTIADKPLISAGTVVNTLSSKRALVNKITELETTLESYDAELSTAALLQAENTQLKAQLNRIPVARGTLAHVVTLPNRSLYDTITIDAGKSEGIVEGQIVYAFDRIALGVVSSVAVDHATITLFSAPGRETSGTVSGSNIAITLIGRGGGEYEVRMPRDVEFVVGGLIAYQSTDTAVLAEIERIATDPRDPFQKLYAKAPINLQALKWVIVR
jgi:cell shape-determining protein MreC